jgi:hypothetical protein
MIVDEYLIDTWIGWRYAVAIGFGQGGGSSVSPALLPPRRTGRYTRLIALVILWILAHEH